MTDGRDGPVHDASRDDLSPLRGTPPPRTLRRDRWSPTPTTEEGRRRARRARWATAGLVLLGVAAYVARFVASAERERRASQVAGPELDLGLPTVSVTARDVGHARAIVFHVQRDLMAFLRTHDDAATTVLRLPADDEAVRVAAGSIADAVVAAGDRRYLWFETRTGAVEDRAAIDRVVAALSRLGVAPANPPAGRSSTDRR